MAKFIFWVLALTILIPLALAAFFLAQIYIFYPGIHTWNLSRMDAKNEQVWRDATARVVTVEVALNISGRAEIFTTDIVCYDGYYARPWNLKSGGPETGKRPISIGFEALQAKLPTGAVLDVDLGALCFEVFREDAREVPIRLTRFESHILDTNLLRYCRFDNYKSGANTHQSQTGATWRGRPQIVAIEERLLRDLVMPSDMETPQRRNSSHDFIRRWGGRDFGWKPSRWRAEEACWTGRDGCSEVMTKHCGKDSR